MQRHGAHNKDTHHSTSFEYGKQTVNSEFLFCFIISPVIRNEWKRLEFGFEK